MDLYLSDLGGGFSLLSSDEEVGLSEWSPLSAFLFERDAVIGRLSLIVGVSNYRWSVDNIRDHYKSFNGDEEVMIL